MQRITIKCSDGEDHEVIAYSPADFPYSSLKENVSYCSKGFTKYINKIATYDIETTTIRHDDMVEGFMYHWQFCIDNMVCFGRTWKEYVYFINTLIKVLRITPKRRLVIWSHNLSFEFQFTRDFFDWLNIFAKEKRKVLRATDVNGIEYRCSYYLTNMSLEKACQEAKHCLFIKQTEVKYDYKKLRTPTTPMNNDELGYCYCDVAGLSEVIEDFLEEDTLASIPMTSTGFVRRDCRNAMRKNPKNRENFKKSRISKEVYELLMEAKRGGNTHANRAFVQTICSNVQCFDISSSYPYAMMVQYYPMTAFTKFGHLQSMEEFRTVLDNYCCLFRIRFENLEVKDNIPVPYISYHKCTKTHENDICFNGRLLKSEACQMTLTEIDFKIIEEQYTFDSMAISDLYIAGRGELPEELKGVIREYYRRKTELKGVDDYLYSKSKNKLNGIFGMTCTDPVHDEITLDEGHGEWHVEKLDVQEQLDKFYDSRNSFLNPAWGIWVTAHARWWLQQAINLSGNHTLYVDTDSDKVQDMPEGWLDGLNQIAIANAEKYGAYADRDGKRYYMGIFDQEEPYERFRTYGAKKYVYEQYNKDGELKLHITIAGVGKRDGALYLEKQGGIEAFKPGIRFPGDFGGGTESHWNDTGRHTLRVYNEDIQTASNVGVLDSTYTLGVTGEFLENMNFNIYKCT